MNRPFIPAKPNQAVWEHSVPSAPQQLCSSRNFQPGENGALCAAGLAGTMLAPVRPLQMHTLLNKYLSHHRHPKPSLLWFRLYWRPVWFYTEMNNSRSSSSPPLFIFLTLYTLHMTYSFFFPSNWEQLLTRPSEPYLVSLCLKHCSALL